MAPPDKSKPSESWGRKATGFKEVGVSARLAIAMSRLIRGMVTALLLVLVFVISSVSHPLPVSVSITSPANGSTVQVGDAVTFSASGTPAASDSGCPAESYSWSGNDGLFGSGPSITWIYNSLGLKTASVTYTQYQAITACHAHVVSATVTIRVENLNQILGVKFHDENGNGQQDPGELGLSGWKITLSGPAKGSALSDTFGNFQFKHLPDGTYTVCEELQSDWQQSFPTVGEACPGGTTGYSVELIGGQTFFLKFGNHRVPPCAAPDLWIDPIEPSNNPMDTTLDLAKGDLQGVLIFYIKVKPTDGKCKQGYKTITNVHFQLKIHDIDGLKRSSPNAECGETIALGDAIFDCSWPSQLVVNDVREVALHYTVFPLLPPGLTPATTCDRTWSFQASAWYTGTDQDPKATEQSNPKANLADNNVSGKLHLITPNYDLGLTLLDVNGGSPPPLVSQIANQSPSLKLGQTTTFTFQVVNKKNSPNPASYVEFSFEGKSSPTTDKFSLKISVDGVALVNDKDISGTNIKASVPVPFVSNVLYPGQTVEVTVEVTPTKLDPLDPSQLLTFTVTAASKFDLGCHDSTLDGFITFVSLPLIK